MGRLRFKKLASGTRIEKWSRFRSHLLERLTGKRNPFGNSLTSTEPVAADFKTEPTLSTPHQAAAIPVGST